MKPIKTRRLSAAEWGTENARHYAARRERFLALGAVAVQKFSSREEAEAAYQASRKEGGRSVRSADGTEIWLTGRAIREMVHHGQECFLRFTVRQSRSSGALLYDGEIDRAKKSPEGLDRDLITGQGGNQQGYARSITHWLAQGNARACSSTQPSASL